ncbi:hypothetical protein AURDEDRAFT_165812 [Auricularia subglabra TFB-10046 SS5]|nr:hypothetical protein AURDEDRAFT_165812 [Auricularia subglabra TFB-10046 SS5]
MLTTAAAAPGEQHQHTDGLQRRAQDATLCAGFSRRKNGTSTSVMRHECGPSRSITTARGIAASVFRSTEKARAQAGHGDERDGFSPGAPSPRPVAPSPSLSMRDDTLAVVIPPCRMNAKPRHRRRRRAAGWFAELAFGVSTDSASESLRSTSFTRSGGPPKGEDAPPHGELRTSLGIASVGDGVSFGDGTSSTSKAGRRR